MNKWISICFVISFFVANTSCKDNRKRQDNLQPYNLNAPDTVYDLPEELNEISALHWYDNHFYSITDERGGLVIFDKHMRLVNGIDFDDKGDYEAVCHFKDKIYALQSDGDIFELDGLNGAVVDEVKKIETGLDEDCEGLFYDNERKGFLIACKNRAKDIDRAIYLYDLEKNEYEILFKFSFKQIEDAIFKNKFDRVALNMKKAFSIKDGAGIFGPSGLAQHPITKNWYILSGTSSLLIVINNKGEVLSVGILPRTLLMQPEGIAFTPDGTMYISSEKASMYNAKILKYTYHE